MVSASGNSGSVEDDRRTHDESAAQVIYHIAAGTLAYRSTNISFDATATEVIKTKKEVTYGDADVLLGHPHSRSTGAGISVFKGLYVFMLPEAALPWRYLKVMAEHVRTFDRREMYDRWYNAAP